MEYRYFATQPGVERPRCWGRSFDSSSSECHRCGVQNSCKDEIIKLNVGRQIPAPSMYQPDYGGPHPASSYAVPQPTQPVYQQQMMARVQPPAPPTVQEAAARALAQIQPPMQQPPYGWLHDPLYYTMAATPPPVRPQMQGESFVERVAKNAALAMIESLFGQCFLAVRQLLLPPKPRTPEVRDAPPPVLPPPPG